MRVQIVYLSPADDIDSTRDKLGWVHAPRALLVWPDRGRVLTNRLDLVKIQRYAQRRNIQIGVLTFDSDVLQIAKELEFPIFDSLEDLPEIEWERDHPTPILLTEETLSRRLETVNQRTLDPVPTWAKAIGRRKTQVPITLILSLTLLLIFFLGPSAEIVLTPVSEENRETFVLTLDLDNSAMEEGVSIPANEVEVDVSGSAILSSSGWTRIPSGSATGFVTFTNHTEDPLSIPQNTSLRTSDSQPIKFRTLYSVTLAGDIGAQAQVAVEAMFPGVIGNVPANTISAIEGPSGLLVSVFNESSISGGTYDLKPIILEIDLEKVEEKLRVELVSLAAIDLRSHMPEDQAMVERGIWIEEIIDREINHDLGDVTEAVELEMRASAVALVYDRHDLKDLIIDLISDSLQDEKELVRDTLVYEAETIVPSQNDGRWRLRVQVTFETFDPIDTRRMGKMIAGRSPDSADRIIQVENQQVNVSKVVINPRWFPVLPLWTERIFFSLDLE